MGYKALAEERAFPTASPVDVLINQHKLARRQIRIQRTDCAEGQDTVYPSAFECVDIRPVVHFGRRYAVTPTVAR